MNCVERVRAICSERKLPISKLERDLGFSNGYIGQLKKGIFPADRLARIAEYLNVTTSYLLTGEEKAPTTEGRHKISDDEIKIALWGTREIDDDVLDRVKQFAKFAQENEKNK